MLHNRTARALGGQRQPRSLQCTCPRLLSEAKLLRANRSSPALASLQSEGVLSEVAPSRFADYTFVYGVSMVQGPRDTMEDEVTVVDTGKGMLVTGVFDGHGGVKAATWLSDNLLDIVINAVEAPVLSTRPPAEVPAGVNCSAELTTILTTLFKDTDSKLLRHLSADAAGRACGATATVLITTPERVVVASVGDSQAVLCRSANPIVLSEPHRVWGFGPSVIAETERVQAAGGWVVDGRVCSLLAVSRSFGDWEFKGEGLSYLVKDGADKGVWTPEFAAGVTFKTDPVVSTPDVSEVWLGEEDEFLLVASDGLWDAMPISEATRWARKEFKAGRSPQQVADSLTAIAMKRYTSDNVAVVVIDLKRPGEWTQKPGRATGQRKGIFSMFG